MTDRLSHTRPHPPVRVVPTVALALLAIVAAVSAAPPEPLPKAFEPGILGLASDPLLVESLGLEMHLPADAQVIAERVNGQVSLTARSVGAGRPEWTLRIQPLTTTLPDPAAVVADHLRRLETAGLEHRVIADEPFNCRGTAGRLCYVEQVGTDGKAYATGWLVLPRGAGEMLMFALLASREALPALRPRLETSFATIGVMSAADVLARRDARLAAGRAVVRGITPERIRSLVGLDEWYRVHRPAHAASGTPAQEIGYSHVVLRSAPRGALEPERAERDYGPAEREPGVLVEIHGRIAIDPGTNAYFDSIGLYWTAWDRSEEAWSVRTTHRTGERTKSESETGVRPRATTGDPRPSLTVVRSTADSYSRRPFEWSVPEIYLEHAVSWFFDRLLPRDDSITEPFAFYTYRGAGGRPAVTLRHDHWTRDDAGSGWMLRSRPSSDEVATVSRFDADGRLVRRISPDGIVTEPATLESLRRLWNAAGLRVGRTGR